MERSPFWSCLKWVNSLNGSVPAFNNAKLGAVCWTTALLLLAWNIVVECKSTQPLTGQPEMFVQAHRLVPPAIQIYRPLPCSSHVQ
ncbi:hypothetical protein WJX77_004700 [Trebouxia sp. C0004]